MALVRGEEEEQEVGGADEELGNLSALVAADEGRGWKTPVVHLKDVIVHFRAEPGNRREVDSEALWEHGITNCSISDISDALDDTLMRHTVSACISTGVCL